MKKYLRNTFYVLVLIGCSRFSEKGLNQKGMLFSRSGNSSLKYILSTLFIGFSHNKVDFVNEKLVYNDTILNFECTKVDNPWVCSNLNYEYFSCDNDIIHDNDYTYCNEIKETQCLRIFNDLSNFKLKSIICFFKENSIEASYKLINFLSKKGIGINSIKNNKGNTPLMYFSSKGECDYVKMLINLGANVKAHNNKRWQAIHFASKKGYYKVIEILVREGARIDSQTNSGGATVELAFEELKTAKQNGNLKRVNRYKKVINTLLNESKNDVLNEYSNIQIQTNSQKNFVKSVKEMDASLKGMLDDYINLSD